MVRAKVTSKGQITIPIEIRRRYQLDAGDEVDFIAEDPGPRMLPVRRRRLTELYAILPTKKAYVGWERIREDAGRALGEHYARRRPRSR